MNTACLYYYLIHIMEDILTYNTILLRRSLFLSTFLEVDFFYNEKLQCTLAVWITAG